MNQYTPPAYNEGSHRLALGVEVIDRLRDMGLMHPVRVDVEQGVPHAMKERRAGVRRYQPAGRAPDAMSRHDSGRYALLYYPGLGTQINLRIYDHDRYYIPRRIQVPLLTEAQIEQSATRDAALRIRRPALFPGAAYDISRIATGLRGSVRRDGQPMRWAVIDAALTGSNALVGRARSDDRGEFVLVLTPDSAPDSDLPRNIDVRVSVAGPVVAPVPDDVDIPGQDPLWDLPLEVLPVPGVPDDISGGDAFPAGYVTALSSVRTVSFEIGRMLTGIHEDPFVFTLP